MALISSKSLDRIRALFGWTASPAPEFMRLKAIAGVLPPLPADSANAPFLKELFEKEPSTVTWDEIQAAKVALVAVMPLEMLQAQFGSLADEFDTVTGGRPFLQWTFPNPPTTVEGWRAGVMVLTEDLAKFRRAKLMFERSRSTVGLIFGIGLISVFLIGFWSEQHVYNALHDGNRIPPLWEPLLFTGFIGAGFSVLSRLYGLVWTPKLTAQVEDAPAIKKGLVITCVLSLAAGMIAAGFLYVLFTAELVTGSLFPKFTEPTGTYASIFIKFLDYQPAEAVDVAKLLAWAFISGFAERLLPDKLNQLAGQMAGASKSREGV